MIINKNRTSFENKLTGFIRKPKYLWKALISQGLPSKTCSCEVNVLKINNLVEHDLNSVLEGFRNYYSTLTENLAKLLLKPINKYSINIIIKYYKHMILGDYFHLGSVLEKSFLTILKAIQVLKAAGIENLSGHFLKDGAKVLSKPISDLCNLSISSEKFPDICKIAQLNPLKSDSHVSENFCQIKIFLGLVRKNTIICLFGV